MRLTVHYDMESSGGSAEPVITTGRRRGGATQGAHRILVVEDDPAMTEGIRDVLELAGYEVLTAADGREALEVMRRTPVELILSDVMMPRMDGFALYEQVRQNPAWTFVPFVFLTALGQRDSITQGKRLGADDYLVKPVDPDHLLATVDARLARSTALTDAAAGELQNFARMVTGVIGHELRTPLTWIRAYSEILLDLRSDMGPEELDSALEGIKSGSDRLTRVVEDAVLLVSLDTGQAIEDYRLAAEVDYSLGARIAAVVEEFRSQAEAAGVALEFESANDLPPVHIAPRYFSSMLRHLLDNGVKYASPGEGAFVRVTAERGPRDVLITVEDNGIGIPANYVNTVFEPLVQVERQQREQQGIGLGLAIVRGLAECHGGSVWVESAEGGGSAFKIALPQAAV